MHTNATAMPTRMGDDAGLQTVLAVNEARLAIVASDST